VEPTRADETTEGGHELLAPRLPPPGGSVGCIELPFNLLLPRDLGHGRCLLAGLVVRRDARPVHGVRGGQVANDVSVQKLVQVVAAVGLPLHGGRLRVVVAEQLVADLVREEQHVAHVPVG
jgi:hypothetical protein